MKITIGLILLFIFAAIIAPFSFLHHQMNDYGTFLAGLAAILAVLKYAMPYLLIFKYREDYSNELILKRIFNISIEASVEGSVPETGGSWVLLNIISECPMNLNIQIMITGIGIFLFFQMNFIIT